MRLIFSDKGLKRGFGQLNEVSRSQSRCQHGEAVRSARSGRRFTVVVDSKRRRRSVMFTRPHSARLHSLHSGSLHIASLFLAVDCVDNDAPLNSQARCRACCSGRSSHHAIASGLLTSEDAALIREFIAEKRASVGICRSGKHPPTRTGAWLRLIG